MIDECGRERAHARWIGSGRGPGPASAHTFEARRKFLHHICPILPPKDILNLRGRFSCLRAVAPRRKAGPAGGGVLEICLREAVCVALFVIGARHGGVKC